MGDMKVLKSQSDLLVTYSLGSCIAVMASDRSSAVGGLLHFMLPESQLDADKAAKRPCMFADTGIAALLGELERCGASRHRLSIRLAGGAQVLDQSRFFNIGERNYTAARRLLWKQGLMIEGEDVGGTHVRTVEMDLATGLVVVKMVGSGDRKL
jgi:chemotaxis protein CheD